MIRRGLGGVVNPIVQSVDLDDILTRIDMDALLVRVDMDAVLSRIDFNAVVDRIDIDAVVERVDVNRLIQRSNLEKIIARSTSGLFTHLLDSIRAQVIRLDQILQNLARCTCCRKRYGWGNRATLPPRPSELTKNTIGAPLPSASEQAAIVNNNNISDHEKVPVKAGDLALAVQGRSAGIGSRALAWLIDEMIVSVSFTLTLALTRVAMNMLDEQNRMTEAQQKARILLIPVILLAWGVVYDAASWAMVGRTVGMAIMGLLVVSHSGKPLRAPQAGLRAMLMGIWVSVVLTSPIGLFRKDRRQLHDLFVCTTVIYAWDARSYQLHETNVSDAEKLGPEFSQYNMNDSDDDDYDDDDSRFTDAQNEA